MRVHDVQPTAQAVHAWVIKSVCGDLEGRGVNVIMLWKCLFSRLLVNSSIRDVSVDAILQLLFRNIVIRLVISVFAANITLPLADYPAVAKQLIPSLQAVFAD